MDVKRQRRHSRWGHAERESRATLMESNRELSSLCGPRACRDLRSHTGCLIYNDFLLSLSVTASVFPLALQFPHSPSHIYSPSHTFRVLFPAVHFRGIFHRHQSTRRTWDFCFILLLVLHLSRVRFACAPQRKMERERSHLQTWSADAGSRTMAATGDHWFEKLICLSTALGAQPIH